MITKEVSARNEADEALDLFFNEKAMAEAEMKRSAQEAKERELFFKAIGIEDDGRYRPIMTRDEFIAFNKPFKKGKGDDLKGKTYIEVFYEFAAYEDISYRYCFEDDAVYVTRFYIGD